MDGTIEAIHAKCIEEGDCWIWQGATDGRDTPVMRLPGSRKLVAVRRFILEMDGRKLGALRATNTCDVRLCVNPEHAIGWKSSKLIKRAAEASGYARQPSRNAKIAEKKRKASPLTPELVQEIRSSPESGHAIAARLGLAQSSIQAIRAYETWKDYSNPFFQLTA